MRVLVNRRPRAQGHSAFSLSSPYDGRIGFWGKVTEVHPEANTCNVLMDTGIEISGVRVASFEWVAVQEDKHLTGERRLPPVDSFVFCLMPAGDLASAFILCSGFLRNEALHADFMEEGEDAANTQRRVEYSGWNYEQDNRTGTRRWQNKTDEDATVELEVNQEDEGEEAVTLTVHGNTISITKDGIEITSDGELSLSIEGDVTLDVTGDASISAGDVTVEASGDATISATNATVEASSEAKVTGVNVEVNGSAQTAIKGGQVVLGGTVTPNGAGALCGLPACLFTGAPQSGNISVGA